MPETLSGTIRSLTFRNDETGYTVAQFEPDDGEAVTVVGVMPLLAVGEAVELLGDWMEHPRYGRQLKVVQVRPVVPTSLAGLERYLGSGLIPGIGPAIAGRIVAHFGVDTAHVLDHAPERLREVAGVGAARAEAIAQAWQSQQAARAALIWLQGHEVSPRLAAKIYEEYGAQTIALVQADPYRLERDIPGVGFQTADRIAQALGVPHDAPERVAAGMSYVLELAGHEGHVYLPFDALVTLAARLLGVDACFAETVLLQRLREEDGLVDEVVAPAGADQQAEHAVYRTWFHRAEVGLADRLALLARAGGDRLATFRSLDWRLLRRVLTEGNAGLALTERQAAAVEAAFTRPLTVLTGGPGTGKTVTLSAVIRLADASGVEVALACPTGRAAKRLSEATGQLAQTVHRLLEVKPQDGMLSFTRNEANPLDADLVIVDEASMLDLLLAYSLVRAIRPGAHLVLVGDVDQLPSVGAGNVLRDVIAAIEAGLPNAALIRLDTIFRQAAGSYIIDNAHRVVRGQMPVTDDPNATDFFLARTDDPTRAAELIDQLVCERIPARFGFSSDDIQVLSPMHRGEAGVAALNTRLQDALNPQWGDLGELKVGERVLREGDRVMQTVNNYAKDVFNGDVGRVLAVNPEEKRLSVDFEGNVVSYEAFELEALTLAYAITIHKSQGSEFPAVVVPVLNSHHIMLQRNLLYTAITRARRLVVLVGDPKAIATAVQNDRVQRRFTALARRLQGQVDAHTCFARSPCDPWFPPPVE
jgi:exodeoxyribonuclease V alpha subunit